MLENIRKFGLRYTDMPTMLWNSAVLLRIMTVNVDPNYKKNIPIKFYVLFIIMFSCYFYVYVFSVHWFVFRKSVQTGDIIDATIVFSLGSGSMISTIKFIYMLLYQKHLRSLIEKYLKFNSKISPDSRYAKNLLKILRGVKRRAMVFWILIVGDGMFYLIKPIFTPGRHMTEEIEFLYGLSPMMESPNFEISYLLTTGGVLFTVYLTASITSFLISITGCIEAQMLCLGNELTLLWDDAKEHYKTVTEDNNIIIDHKEKQKILNEYVKRRLRDIVDMHTSNIYFMQTLDKVFRYSIAVEFILLIISIIAEFLGGIETTYVLMPFELVQVTMDCITGQKLIDSSAAFEAAVYDNKWENFDLRNMKTVLLMMLNCQREMALSAGGVATLSYLCLMSVGRMIYSIYTALRTTMA